MPGAYQSRYKQLSKHRRSSSLPPKRSTKEIETLAGPTHGSRHAQLLFSLLLHSTPAVEINKRSTNPRTAIPGSTSDACLSLYDSSSHYCTWFSPAFRHVKACAYNLWISACTNVQLLSSEGSLTQLDQHFPVSIRVHSVHYSRSGALSSHLFPFPCSAALPGASAPPRFPWARHSSASQLPPPNSEPHQQLPRTPRARLRQVFKKRAKAVSSWHLMASVCSLQAAWIFEKAPGSSLPITRL